MVFGLYGSANGKWGMSSRLVESPIFDTFWDTISFIINGIIFFFAGASSVNFFWRSSEVCFSGHFRKPTVSHGRYHLKRCKYLNDYVDDSWTLSYWPQPAVLMLQHVYPVLGSFLARVALLIFIVDIRHTWFWAAS